MAEIKNKIVNLESLKELHEYNEKSYSTKVELGIETNDRNLADQNLQDAISKEIQDRTNDVSTERARIDTILTENTLSKFEEVLYQSADTNSGLGYPTQKWTLTATSNNATPKFSQYDYLDLYVGFWGKIEIKRISATDGSYTVRSSNIPNDASGTSKGLAESELTVTLSGSTITIDTATKWSWTGVQSVDSTMAVATSSDLCAGYIFKIVGIVNKENSELVDGRIGIDGTKYNNIGDAIRGQMTNEVTTRQADNDELNEKLNEDISNVNETLLQLDENKADKTEVNELKETLDDVIDITGLENDISNKVVWMGYGFINSISGESNSSSAQNYCDYLDISGNYDTLTYSRVLSTNQNDIYYGLVFYDENKIFISSDVALNKQPQPSFDLHTIDIPENAVYIRTAMWYENCNVNDFKIILTKNGKVKELDENVKKYKPYQSGQIHFTVDSIKSINPLFSGEDGTLTDDICLDTTVIQKMNAVLSLPVTYTKNKKQTPLIMLCHGWGGTVSETQWCDDKEDFISFISYLNSHGYAVFDVDSTDGLYHSPNPDLGCPQLLTAYMKAYEYIKDNYNVESMFHVYALSFGSFTGMNILQLYGNYVKSAIISGARMSLKYIYDGWTNYRVSIATKYGFDDKTGSTYEVDKMQPYDTYANIITFNETDYILKNYPPMKFILGGADNMCWSQTYEVANALKNSGNIVTIRKVKNADHNHVCYAVSDGLKEEVASWFDRFN